MFKGIFIVGDVGNVMKKKREKGQHETASDVDIITRSGPLDHLVFSLLKFPFLSFSVS